MHIFNNKCYHTISVYYILLYKQYIKPCYVTSLIPQYFRVSQPMLCDGLHVSNILQKLMSSSQTYLIFFGILDKLSTKKIYVRIENINIHKIRQKFKRKCALCQNSGQ